MTKLDFKRAEKPLYAAKRGQWQRIEVPRRVFVGIDGQGDPNGPGYARALAALYPVAYGIKAQAKAAGADFTVPPLEALWWADDPAAFTSGDRSAWRWTALIRMPDGTDEAAVQAARDGALAKLARKKDAPTDAATMGRVRHVDLTEGDCLQTLHLGPYTDEAPVLADLHDRLMPELGLTFNGPHHEVYLGDPRRTAPEKLKTILRQPVAPAGQGAA